MILCLSFRRSELRTGAVQITVRFAKQLDDLDTGRLQFQRLLEHERDRRKINSSV